MSVEQNKELMRHWFEGLLSRGEYERVAEFVAEDCVAHGWRGSVPRDPAAWVKTYQPWYTAFPDIRITIERLVAEGDTVTACFRFSGTHTGAFVTGGLTVPPTGRLIDVREVVIFRFVDGKVVEAWAVWDRLDLLQQLDAATLAAQV